jgi:hypothetical protein
MMSLALRSLGSKSQSQAARESVIPKQAFHQEEWEQVKEQEGHNRLMNQPPNTLMVVLRRSVTVRVILPC